MTPLRGISLMGMTFFRKKLRPKVKVKPPIDRGLNLTLFFGKLSSQLSPKLRNNGFKSLENPFIASKKLSAELSP
jgi:hypothetical protein